MRYSESEDFEVPRALSKDGVVVYPEDYEREKHAPCICAVCMNPVRHRRQSAEGKQQRRPHFTHLGRAVLTEGLSCSETRVHFQAKYEIAGAVMSGVLGYGEVPMVLLCCSACAKDIVQPLPGEIDGVHVEQTLFTENGYRRVDVALKVGELTVLAVEVAVTHWLDDVKRLDLEELRVQYIEVGPEATSGYEDTLRIRPVSHNLGPAECEECWNDRHYFKEPVIVQLPESTNQASLNGVGTSTASGIDCAPMTGSYSDRLAQFCLGGYEYYVCRRKADDSPRAKRMDILSKHFYLLSGVSGFAGTPATAYGDEYIVGGWNYILEPDIRCIHESNLQRICSAGQARIVVSSPYEKSKLCSVLPDIKEVYTLDELVDPADYYDLLSARIYVD